MFSALEKAFMEHNETAIQTAVFEMGQVRDENGYIPDEFSFKIIDLLRKQEMETSSLAGHLLNHFEFHAENLSPVAKSRCKGFLNAWGDKFKHIHSQQIAAELRSGSYLNESN